MADNGVWFKLWCAADDDTDLDNLDISDYGRWCKFGTYTKRHGDAGVVRIVAPARTLCTKLQVANFDELEGAIRRFPHVKVCQKSVTNAFVTLICEWSNWYKYQVDNSTDRVRRHRKRVTIKKRRDEKRRDEKRREPTSGDAVDLIFEAFWKAYPRKTKKQEAYKAWCKEAKLSPDIQGAIFAALDWQVRQAQWNRDGGQYIPHPASWLNGKRWQDEKPEVTDGKPTSEPKGYESFRQFRAIRDRVR